MTRAAAIPPSRPSHVFPGLITGANWCFAPCSPYKVSAHIRHDGYCQDYRQPVDSLISRNGRDNSIVEGDMTAQVKTVMANASEILKAAGLSHDDVVSAKVYITDTARFQEMNAAYRPYFAKQMPARATVKASLTGPQYLVEVTMIAVAGRKETINTSDPPSPNLSSPSVPADACSSPGCWATPRRRRATRPPRRARRSCASTRRSPPPATRAPTSSRPGLPDGRGELRRDERRLPRVLRERLPGAGHRAGRSRGAGRAGRDHGHGLTVEAGRNRAQRTLSTEPIRIGISSCLLGEEVRFDGGHKRDSFLVDTFGKWVEWVMVCPRSRSGWAPRASRCASCATRASCAW